MSIVTDERLMAYADGALPEAEAHALEIMISEDPALAARLKPFAMTGAPLAEVFEEIASEPIPDRLMKAVTKAATSGARISLVTERVPVQQQTGFASWLARALGIEESGMAFANAFAVAGLVVAGGIAGYTLANQGGERMAFDIKVGKHGEIVAGAALASALETRASSDAAGSDGVATRSAFLAKTASGESSYCREYRITASGTEAFGGVACRAADGTWRVATHTRLQSKASGNGYATASGYENPAIDATVGAMIQGDILTADEETALRAKGWK